MYVADAKRVLYTLTFFKLRIANLNIRVIRRANKQKKKKKGAKRESIVTK